MVNHTRTLYTLLFRLFNSLVRVFFLHAYNPHYLLYENN